MPAPFLRLLLTRSWGPKNLKVILATSGPTLFCFSSVDGSLLSKWSHVSAPSLPSTIKADESEPPAKKRRISSGDVSDAPSAEVVVDNESAQKPPRKKKKVQPVPSVSKLVATSDGKYVVVVTNEDKTVRVLEMVDGQLSQLSERQMPKKPSAIALTPDQSSILAADKFGDVYELPILVTQQAAIVEDAPAAKPQEEVKPFKPAATNKTVHTRKNLQALENQMKAKPQVSTRKVIEFEHKVLLGHVSLLTDLLAITHKVDGKGRSYILTSDRDEHIRITRGIPQTHVIEGFCMGHTNFVNKLLIPATQPDLLISGGGDDYVLVWDWIAGRSKSRISLLEHVNAVRVSLLSLEDGSAFSRLEHEEGKIAVSGLWAVPVDTQSDAVQPVDILVACEAVPTLLVFQLVGHDLEYKQSISLDGNPLDVVVGDGNGAIMVSVDSLHRPGSTSEVILESSRPFVQTFVRSGGDKGWLSGGPMIDIERSINHWSTNYPGHEADVDQAALSELFYGIEHLRKRGGAENEGEDE